MRIVIDLDGTICELRKAGQSYAEVRPNPGVAEKIRALKDAGHYVIIQTARHMKTCSGDVSQVIERVGEETKRWLTAHSIPYDEIHFGKHYGDVYIDDLAYSFRSWGQIRPDKFDDELINIVIPLAGRGARFKEAGYRDPKPLIMAGGRAMITHAVESFDLLRKEQTCRLIFIISKEDDSNHELGKQLQALFTDSQILIIPEVTRGQAETCLAARDYIDTYNKLIIHNGDTFVSAPNLARMIDDESPDGILICFRSTESRFSYAEVDARDYVVRTAEKEVISDLASTGTYYFKRGSDFVAAAEAMIAEGKTTANEFYVAPCYNELLKSGKRIRTCIAEEYAVFGTPGELEAFEMSRKNHHE